MECESPTVAMVMQQELPNCTVCRKKLIIQEVGTYRGRKGERCEDCWAVSPYLPCRPQGESGGNYLPMSGYQIRHPSKKE